MPLRVFEILPIEVLYVHQCYAGCSGQVYPIQITRKTNCSGLIPLVGGKDYGRK